MKFFSLFFMFLFLVSQAAQSSEAKQEESYVLIEKVVVAEHGFDKGRYFLAGIEFANKPVEQGYVVFVPGSEGYPPRLENRIQTIQLSDPKAHNHEARDLIFRNNKGDPITWEEAAKLAENTALVVAELKQ